MRVSKNKYRGPEITDLRKVKDLALQRRSVVIEMKNGFRYVRPAAFLLGWSLMQILKCKIYYSIDKTSLK